MRNCSFSAEAEYVKGRHAFQVLRTVFDSKEVQYGPLLLSFYLLGSSILNYVALLGDEVYPLLPELHNFQYMS